eukprot:gene9822-biopygen4306
MTPPGVHVLSHWPRGLHSDATWTPHGPHGSATDPPCVDIVPKERSQAFHLASTCPPIGRVGRTVILHGPHMGAMDPLQSPHASSLFPWDGDNDPTKHPHALPLGARAAQ